MKKTYQELVEIDQAVGILYKEDPTLKDKKFGYAYQKTAERSYLKLNKQLSEEMEDARIDFASEDEKTKVILRDENPNSRGYQYSKDNLKLLVKKEREIFNKYLEKEIEFEPYFCNKDSLPELTEYQIELFKGILFEE